MGMYSHVKPIMGINPHDGAQADRIKNPAEAGQMILGAGKGQ